MNKVIIASQNKHKLQEFNDISSLMGFNEFFTVKNISQDIGEIDESALTYVGNAQIKARIVFEHYQQPVLADDSGLEIMSLNNIPGIKSARYAGCNATAADNRNKLSKLIKSTGQNEVPARFRCALVYKTSNEHEVSFEKYWYGSVCAVKFESKGFGYDAMFVPEGYSSPVTDMAASVKNTISHRAKALEDFFRYITFSNF